MNYQDDAIEHFKKAFDLANTFKSFVKFCDICIKLSTCYNK